MIRCPRCQHENPAAQKFCGECGTRLDPDSTEARMGRRTKPAKAKVQGKRPPAPKSRKAKDARVRNLKKRLAEALEHEAGALTREAEALGRLQARDRDLTAALEQQTATAQVLELIASSPGDLQPTFDGIVQRARQLCDGLFSVLYGVRGELVTIEADDHVTPENRQLQRSRFPMAMNANAIVRRVFLEHRVVHVEDAAADPHFQQIPFRQVIGYRTLLLVPMLRDGAVIGAIGVGRVEPGGFADRQVRLLQTFAAQAVIAIENVRLFKELEARNRDLTEALEQQTGTSDVLRVISQSQTDVQPVFDALIDSALRLCVADLGAISRFDGEVLRLVIPSGMPAEVRAFWQEHPIRPGRESVTGRAALERRTIHVPDILAAPSYDYTSPESVLRQGQAVTGYRATLVTPMLREDTLIGTIAIMRREPRERK